MAKPTRIQHGGVGIYLDDKQADRVQTLGSTTALNVTELKEVGNVNIVEVIDGIPKVDITLDSNQYGSVKTISQLANKNFNYGYPQLYASSGLNVHVGTGDFYIEEQKYNKAAETEVDMTAHLPASASHWIVVVASISTAGAVTLTDGTEFDPNSEDPNYPTTPVGELKLAEVYLYNSQTTIEDDYILNIHDPLSVTLNDFEYSKVDIVVPVKETGDNTDTDEYITRTMYIENAFCNRIDSSFNTNGLSTENFTLESDNKRWFLNGARAVIVDRLARAVDPGVYVLTYDATQLLNLKYTLKVRCYNTTTDEYTDFEEGVDYHYDTGTHAIHFEAGKNPSEGVLIFRYCANQNISSSFKMLPDPKESHPDPPGGVNQGQVEIYLTDDLDNFVLRIESCTITADLTREELNEIGHALPYDRPMTFPIPVTIAVNTKASDLEEFARMMGRKADFDADTIAEMSIDKFSKDLGLTVKIYREPDTKRDETPWMFQPVLKTLTITDVSVTDEKFDISVDADATQTFNLKADNMTITAVI